MARKRTYFITVIIGILLIAGITAGGYWLYRNRQDKIDSLQSQVSALQAGIKNQSQQQGDTNNQSSKTSITADSGTSYKSPKGVQITLYHPAKNATVSSPVAVLGQVPGNWSSEASFPVVLKDSDGKVVAETTATVLGDWMTNKLVPFSAKLTYSSNPTGSGTLILQRDNPSGLPSNDDTITIPIRF